MSDTDDSLYGDSVYESGVEDAEDLDPAENLTGDGLTAADREQPYDTGYSPPDRRPAATRYGTTDREQAEGESLAQRLTEEEPDLLPADAGRVRGAASAEEAAMHLVAEPEAGDFDDLSDDPADPVLESDEVDD